MKLDLNKPLLDLEGNPLEKQNIGKSLAVLLANASEGPAIKFIDWAMMLHKGEAVELDTTDMETLRRFIEGQPGATNLFKSAVLKAIIQARDAKTLI